jgi:GNAT superfamily N-acetyltransferase
VRLYVRVQVTVSQATVDQLTELTDCLGQCEYFADRLARQDRGEGVVLVAWLEGRAVGDVYLWCAPVDEPEICEHLTGVPMLNHLEVHPDRRGQGIGTAIIEQAERLAVQMGHRRLSIGVGIDNPRAYDLYLRLGYTDWGHGTVDTTYARHQPDGTVRRFAETIRVLAKPLPSERAG